VTANVPTGLSMMINKRVSRDPADPGHRVAAPVKCVAAANGRNECLLGDFLGEVTLTASPRMEVAEHAR
jgi:hypothetical protein